MIGQSAFRQRFGRRSLVAALLAAFALLCPGTHAQEVRDAPEYNVKAGYLLLFARYVQWPEHAFANDEAPLVIGVLGKDPFGEALVDTLRDQRVGMRPVLLLRMRDLETVAGVHVLFIANGQTRDEQRWLASLRDKPILRVSESEDALPAGAIVRFVEDRGRIRFDVDYGGAARSQLRILSPMLVSARRVHGAPPDLNKERDGAKRGAPDDPG